MAYSAFKISSSIDDVCVRAVQVLNTYMGRDFALIRHDNQHDSHRVASDYCCPFLSHDRIFCGKESLVAQAKALSSMF